MKIVIAPDKFKGSLSGPEFCDAVAEGIKKIIPEVNIVKMPLADGGDGTAEIVGHYLKGERISVVASDPLFRASKCTYLYDNKSLTAYIEMAGISGLQLLNSKERNCMHTTSLGTGELLADALKIGAKKLILGIGGSATNDGGMGVAAALGFRFLDKNGMELQPLGRNLIKVVTIDDSKRQIAAHIELKIACDVSSPFYGKDGASYVYGAQKGASQSEIELLDAGLRNFAKVIFEKYQIDIQKTPGAGAAGGIGGGAMALLGGTLVSGIELIKELAHFEETISNADWIITGEGKLDSQTLFGKTISGVLQSALKGKIPVAAFCGAVALSQKETNSLGLNYVAAISKESNNLKEAIRNAYPNLVKASQEFARTKLI